MKRIIVYHLIVYFIVCLSVISVGIMTAPNKVKKTVISVDSKPEKTVVSVISVDSKPEKTVISAEPKVEKTITQLLRESIKKDIIDKEEEERFLLEYESAALVHTNPKLLDEDFDAAVRIAQNAKNTKNYLRVPPKDFDTYFYLIENPDVAVHPYFGKHPYEHYVYYGKTQNRRFPSSGNFGSAKNTIVGKWNWWGGVVDFQQDGSGIIHCDDKSRNGTSKWKCLGAGLYQAVWNDGMIDYIILSSDGNNLVIKNNKKVVREKGQSTWTAVRMNLIAVQATDLLKIGI